MTTNEPGRVVRDIMGTTLYTVTPDTGVVSAARLAFEDKVRHLLVLENGTLTGVVSHRDLARAKPQQMVVQVMRAPVLCIDPSTTVEEAAQIMQEQGVSFLPVVSGAFVLGFVDDYVIAGKERPVPAIATPNAAN